MIAQNELTTHKLIYIYLDLLLFRLVVYVNVLSNILTLIWIVVLVLQGEVLVLFWLVGCTFLTSGCVWASTIIKHVTFQLYLLIMLSFCMKPMVTTYSIEKMY